MGQFEIFDDFRDYQHRQPQLMRVFSMFEDYCKAVLSDAGGAGIKMEFTGHEPGKSFTVDYLGRSLTAQWVTTLNEHGDAVGMMIFTSPLITDARCCRPVQTIIFNYSGVTDFDAGNGVLAMTADSQAPLILMEVFKRFLAADPLAGNGA